MVTGDFWGYFRTVIQAKRQMVHIDLEVTAKGPPDYSAVVNSSNGFSLYVFSPRISFCWRKKVCV